MTRKLWTLIIFYILCTVFEYVAFAFTNWQFNPGKWNDTARFMFPVIDGFIVLVLIFIATNDSK